MVQGCSAGASSLCGAAHAVKEALNLQLKKIPTRADAAAAAAVDAQRGRRERRHAIDAKRA